MWHTYSKESDKPPPLHTALLNRLLQTLPHSTTEYIASLSLYTIYINSDGHNCIITILCSVLHGVKYHHQI